MVRQFRMRFWQPFDDWNARELLTCRRRRHKCAWLDGLQRRLQIEQVDLRENNSALLTRKSHGNLRTGCRTPILPKMSLKASASSFTPLARFSGSCTPECFCQPGDQTSRREEIIASFGIKPWAQSVRWIVPDHSEWRLYVILPLLELSATALEFRLN